MQLRFFMYLSQMYLADEFLNKRIQERKDIGALRTLNITKSQLIDFCSNDYLGLARTTHLHQKNLESLAKLGIHNGSTGSRLLCGNTSFAEELEKKIATFHQSNSALLYNSGYDANIGLFSCIAQKNDTFIIDSLVHASIIDGIRLSKAKKYNFAHNNLEQLERKLKIATGHIFVVVESVYSMDGDTAPLLPLVNICKKYKAHLIVDEAHAIGVFGQNGVGVCQQLNIQDQVFARIMTYGKALGCHGASILGSETLKKYLINFSRSFIYTTAAPLHNLVAIDNSYQYLKEQSHLQKSLSEKISFFKEKTKTASSYTSIKSESAIQSWVIGGNEKTVQIAQKLQKSGFDIRAIRSPTVAEGTERLRICLHEYNSFNEIEQLTKALHQLS